MNRLPLIGSMSVLRRALVLFVALSATAAVALSATWQSPTVSHTMHNRPPVRASVTISQPTFKFVCGIVATSGIAKFISAPVGDLPGTKPKVSHVINQPNTCMVTGDYGHNMVILTIVAGSKSSVAKQYAAEHSTSQYGAYELDRIHLKPVHGYRNSFASYTPEGPTTDSGQIYWIAPNGQYLVELHFSWLFGGQKPDSQVQMIQAVDSHLIPNHINRPAGPHAGLAGPRPSKPDKQSDLAERVRNSRLTRSLWLNSNLTHCRQSRSEYCY